MPHDHEESARCHSAKAREQPLAICAKKGESNTKGSVHNERGIVCSRGEKLSYTLTYTFGHIA